MTAASFMTASGSPSAMTRPRPSRRAARRPGRARGRCARSRRSRRPARRSSRIVATSSSASSSVRPAPISSRSSTRGSVASARASSSRLRCEQAERLGRPVRERGQLAQVEHLDQPAIRGLAPRVRRRSTRRRGRSRTPSCRRTASAPGARGRSRAGSACAAPARRDVGAAEQRPSPPTGAASPRGRSAASSSRRRWGRRCQLPRRPPRRSRRRPARRARRTAS